MANKKNKRRNKRKRKNARNQYTCTKKVILEQNSDNATSELSSPTVTQQTLAETEDDSSALNQSTSFQKLNISVANLENIETNEENFFFLMNFCILKSMIKQVCICRSCNGDNLEIRNTDKKGLSLEFYIECNDCKWTYNFFSSPEFKFPGKDSRGQKSFEVNIRSVIAFREIGRGHEAMKTFSSMMNMPKPLAIASFNDINNNLHQTYIDTALDSMKSAANEVRTSIKPGASESEMVDCHVSVDGSWHKRGHSSMNGFVSAISPENKKVIDYQVFSKFCKGCLIWEQKKGTNEYNRWKETHICKINHYQSSGAMESAGAVSIFSSSIEKYNMRYSHYIGDGDTESFKKVVDSKPYGDDLTPKKLECVGHVQKRLGTRLRKLRIDMKGKLLSDGKKINGKGRLTDKVCNKMQNYFGMAIRQNTAAACNNDRKKALYGMKKGVLAVLWHCTDLPDYEDRHKYCPRENDSWCKYWQTKQDYKSSVNLPVAIHKVILPIFQNLCNDELLSRCLDGTTQNPNEAVNQIVWKKCPKDTFISKMILEIGAASAVINFNDGMSGFEKLFRRLNLSFGVNTKKGAIEKDEQRIKNMKNKSQGNVKRKRKKLRAVRKGYIDKEKENEGGESYLTGNF